jgi:hypothetical protein
VPGPLETIQKEWPVIRGAPWSLLILGGVLVVATWGFFKLIHDAEISGKDATIESQKTEIGAYKDKLSGATPDQAKKQLDDAKAEIENSNKRVADLEMRLTRVEPRGLKDKERIAITTSLESIGVAAGNIIIAHEMSCTDCAQYATDFGDVLKGAHWGFVPSGVIADARASPKGLAIITPDTSNPLPEAKALADALTAAKMPFDMAQSRGPSMQNLPSVELLITPRSTP